MSITLYPPARPRTFPELLDASLKIFRVSLPKCMPYATIAILFGELSTLYDLARGQLLTPRSAVNDPTWITLYCGGSVLFFVVWMALLLRQSAVAAGRPPGTRDLLEALKQAPAIVAISLIASLAVALLILPPLSLAEPYRSIVFGAMLVPAIYLSVALSLALPARMLTGKGVVQSLLYSLRLVHGNWWRAAVMYIAGAAIIAVVSLLVAVMAALVLPNPGHADADARAVLAAVALAVAAMGLNFYTAIVLSVFGDLELRRAGHIG
ncbi:MAG: hypothetical protein ACYCUE_10700 [Steroidobacteraceae bacterium]